MFTSLKLKATNFFTSGHERTLKAKKNIALSFIMKGGTIAISLILIPMTINYVNPTEYGIWLTLSSIIGWFNFFDIGLGNGLKNKLAEANALGKSDQAKTLVSTTYAILTIISLVLFLVFLIINRYTNWKNILNIPDNLSIPLYSITLIVFGSFCIQFVFQLINTILTASHEPSKVSFIFLVGQLISLVTIYILTKTTTGSLTNLVMALAGAPLLVLLAASIWFYGTSYKQFAPNLFHVNFKYARNLISVGGVFFVIQIGAMVLFQTDNIVITQLFGPSAVTTFNVGYKLFNAVTMVFTIVITPFWSAFTDAYAKEDFAWIKKTIEKLRKYWLFLSGFSLLLLVASPLIYQLWLGKQLEVPFSLSIAMTVYVIAYTWQTIHVFMLNGIGKIRLQLYLVIISAILNIPLAILLGKWIGLAGVTLANALEFIIMGIIFSIQCRKIIDKTAGKIWNK